MKKQQFKQNVKQKVQDIEHSGLRLLKKGQKGFFHAVFSRFGIVLLLLLAQLWLLFALYQWFNNLLPHYVNATMTVEAIMVLYLLNTDMDNSAKITWLVVMALTPVLGISLFWYTKSGLGNRAMKTRALQLEDETRSVLSQDEKVLQDLGARREGAASLARYLNGRGGGFPVYENTAATYFSGGEDMLSELLNRLERAEHFVFLEYFIIDEGIMWGNVLEILARKAAEGVEVRVMYDGTCEFSTLPRDYPQRLEKLGIHCRVFSPVMPFVSTHYNYRDHRKILVIDGHTAFTGGVNLADEYINAVPKYGRWKDAALMLEGEAARSMTALFLQMWAMLEKPEFERFLPEAIPVPEGACGFAAPYGDCPLDGVRVAEMVYIDLLNRAQRYIHIITPYLILDGELETALAFAAQRGVDVHLILPGIPDKKFAYALAKTHYAALLEAGVKISEFTPGFCHAKVFVLDDREAVVGTINLDYRSLYHHFENAVWLLDSPCIADIEADFQATLKQCRAVENTPASIWQGRHLLHLEGIVLKVLSPLL